MRLGILLTVLNIAFNVVFITGLGPFPRMGTAGAAVGTTVASSSWPATPDTCSSRGASR